MKKLSISAKSYILGSILTGLLLMGLDLIRLNWNSLWLLLGLSALSSLSLILKVEGTTKRSHYNISFLLYAFTFVLIGPEEAVFVVLISNLVEWAWHRYPWYIQSFNIASYIIAFYITGWIYRYINPEMSLMTMGGIGSILVAMAVFTMLNHFLVGVVVWLARGENFKKSGVFDFFPLMLDFILLCMGVGAAVVWMLNPFAVVLTLLPLYLIYSTLKVPALERQSETDPKTGLFNARFFERALKNELNRANRFDRPMTIVMADLDLLRNINNTYGHLAGDQVLIGVAKLLKESVRDYDIVARFGGEEYAILMAETTPEDAYSHVDAIRANIEKAEFSVPTSVTPIKATISFGIAGREGFNQSPSNIVHNADTALYHAKLRGRNRTSLFTKEISENFNNGHADTPIISEESFEARIQMAQSPYRPSALREVDPVEESTLDQTASGVDEVTHLRAPWVINVFISVVFLLAMGLFALVFKPVPQLDWFGLLAFAMVVLLTEWLSIDIYVNDASVSTSAAPIMAGTLLFGPLGALVLSLTFAAVTTFKHHSPLSRLIFNFGNQMLACMLYTALIAIVGVPFSAWPPLAHLVMSLVAAGVIYLSTTLLISLAIEFDLGLPFKQVWKEKFSWLAPHYGSMGLIAYALLFSFRSAGLIGMFVTLVPLLLVRFSQKQYIDRTRAMVAELKEKNTILEKSAGEIHKLNEGLLEALAEVIDLRDPFVLGHSRQVSHYAVLMAGRLQLPERQIEFIRKAGLLHDIGKLGISESILFKPTSLSPEEYHIVKQHVILGADILVTSHALRNLIPIIRYHHERFDGRGYPDGLKGQEIPLEARIIGVADAIEAMASDRPYRRGLQQSEIILELKAQSGSQFDPMVVNAFLEMIESDGESLIVNSARKVPLSNLSEGIKAGSEAVLFEEASLT
ncbi:MAG TPA: diguanylate cyclase [Anaerolineales bacterium]|nr:diguanylate cyclase [Anaerolineales bacterium]